MLSGSLDLFALADVLRFVARSGVTGAVNIHRPEDGGRILLFKGEVVGATIDGFEPRDTDGVVDAGLRLLDAAGGEFSLDVQPATGPIRSPVEEFLTAVGQRRAEWTKILDAVGSPDGPLVLSPSLPPGASEITLSPLEWRIVVLSDGRRSIRDIARELGESEFAAAKALLAMANAGMLGFEAGGAAGPGEAAFGEATPADRDQLPGGAAPEPPVEEPGSPPDAAEEAGGDPDPAALLRELVGDGPPPPRARRRGTPSTREEQRLRLRSR